MKKFLMTLGLAVLSCAAFAQGKIGFVNDSLHLFVFHDTMPGDGAGGGSSVGGTTQGAITGAVLPSGVHLVAGLYAGTSSTSLTLQTGSTQILEGSVIPQAGRMASKSVVLTGIAGGSPVFFQVQIWDNAFASAAAAEPFSYYGYSSIFQATPGTSVTYPPIAPQGGAASSTWAPENVLIHYFVPEPSTGALAFLGGFTMLLFRRRKV